MAAAAAGRTRGMRFSPQVLCIAGACFLAGVGLHDKLLTTPPPAAVGPGLAAAGVETDPVEAGAPAVQRLRFPSGDRRPASSLNDTLLILSPVRNRGSTHKTPIGHFVALIDKLQWPKSLTSVALLEGDSNDDTWEVMQDALSSLKGYHSVQALKKDFGPLPGGGGGGGEGRHAVEVQLIRRQRLAQVGAEWTGRCLHIDVHVDMPASASTYPHAFLTLVPATLNSCTIYAVRTW